MRLRLLTDRPVSEGARGGGWDGAPRYANSHSVFRERLSLRRGFLWWPTAHFSRLLWRAFGASQDKSSVVVSGVFCSCAALPAVAAGQG